MAMPHPRKLGPAQHLRNELNARNSIEEAIKLGERLLEQLRALDLRAFESMPAAVAVHHLSVGPVPELVRLMGRSIRLVRSLPSMMGVAGAPDPAAEIGAVVGADGEPSGSSAVVAVEGRPVPRRDRFVEDLDIALRQPLPREASASDALPWMTLCGDTVEQLQAVLRWLRDESAQGSKWGLITAAEEARHKGQKGLRAVLLLAMRLMSTGAQAASLLQRTSSELDTALSLRDLLLGFRDDVLVLVADAGALSDTDLALQVREARIRLVQLVSDRSYQDLRAPDRYEVQQMLAQVSAWIDAGARDPASARLQLSALGRFAVGLAIINKRRILLEHDQACRSQGLQQLAVFSASSGSLPERGRRLSEIVRGLASLRWRSPQLSAALVAAAETHEPAAVDALLARALQLSAVLGVVQVES